MKPEHEKLTPIELAQLITGEHNTLDRAEAVGAAMVLAKALLVEPPKGTQEEIANLQGVIDGLRYGMDALSIVLLRPDAQSFSESMADK